MQASVSGIFYGRIISVMIYLIFHKSSVFLINIWL